MVTAFVARINAHDPLALAELMTDDHVFIDGLGNRHEGRSLMIEGWKQYFAMVPDYWIRTEVLLSSDGTVAVFGRAGGTYAPGSPPEPSQRWEVPAAWRAEVRGDRLGVWQVYADNLPLRQLRGSERAS